MSKRMVRIDSADTTIEVEAHYGTRTEFGCEVDDRKSIITSATIYKSGALVGKIYESAFDAKFGPVSRPMVYAAAAECYDELTGTTAESRATEEARKDAEYDQYLKARAATVRALNI
jgi:hypothetical protein